MRRWFVGTLAVLVVATLSACSSGGGGGGTAPKIASFSASSGTANGVVTSGGSATLAWSLSGGAATSVTVDHGVGSVSGGASVSVSPVKTTTYTLTVSNAAGADTATATVTVGISAKAISMNNEHALAVDQNDHVLAWGGNALGELGDGSTTTRRTAVAVSAGSGLGTVQLISAGSFFSLALDQSGVLWSWGDGSDSELGNGSAGSDTPLKVSASGGPSGDKVVAAGFTHSLVADGSDAPWSWGLNVSGELGTYSSLGSPQPTTVYDTDMGTVTALAAGEFFSLAVDGSGYLWGWGDGGANGTGSGGWDHPVKLGTGTGFTAVSAGYLHGMALNGDGTVWAWGDNSKDQVGDPSNTSDATPYHLTNSNLSNIVAIAAGAYHSLALRSDGTVWAWGDNSSGELGNGGNTTSTTPTQVSGLSHVKAIAAGNAVSLALEADGSVWAWGANNLGQLGNGGSSSSSVPVQVLTTP